MTTYAQRAQTIQPTSLVVPFETPNLNDKPSAGLENSETLGHGGKNHYRVRTIHSTGRIISVLE